MKLPWSPIVFTLMVIIIAIPIWLTRHGNEKEVIHEKFPCPKILSIDITNGIRTPEGIVKDNITYPQSYIYSSENRTWGCVCNFTKCIRKCCAENEVMVEDECVESTINSFDVTFYEEPNTTKLSVETFFIVYGDRCNVNYFGSLSGSDIYIQENGTLMVQFEEEDDPLFYYPENYCVDREGDEKTGIICEYFDPGEYEANDDLLLPIGMMISIPFLFVTFVIYAISPEYSLHQKALMSYVLALMIAFICILSIQIDPVLSSIIMACHLVGYCTIYFFTASFLWMNVMCIDMWLTFSGSKGFGGQKNGENKRFIIYCLYAWGFPFLQILVIFMINMYGDEESPFHPQVGKLRCFVEEGLPKLIYFFPPMTIAVSINLILFVLILTKIRKVKKETAVLKRTDSQRHFCKEDKHRFSLFVKMMYAMGMNWLLDVISSVIDNQLNMKDVWFIQLIDFLNSLYGVVIFYIFVFNKKTWLSLKKKYYICIGKPHLAHTESISRNTRSSNFSSSENRSISNIRMERIST